MDDDVLHNFFAGVAFPKLCDFFYINKAFNYTISWCSCVMIT